MDENLSDDDVAFALQAARWSGLPESAQTPVQLALALRASALKRAILGAPLDDAARQDALLRASVAEMISRFPDAAVFSASDWRNKLQRALQRMMMSSQVGEFLPPYLPDTSLGRCF